MEILSTHIIIGILLSGGLISFLLNRFLRYGFYVILVCLVFSVLVLWFVLELQYFLSLALTILLPLLFINTILYGVISGDKQVSKARKVYRVKMKTKGSNLVLENIRRGVSVIASAGSGKTESVIYNFLQHFKKQQFCGVIHDYKNFEITEMAWPLFQKSGINFYVVSFDPIYHKVNPIAPRYLPDEESVYEVSRVLLENLLELKERDDNSTSRFFKDAVEGLISGLIWRLKTDYPDYCTIPHLIALYQQLSTKGLIGFLKADITSRAMGYGRCVYQWNRFRPTNCRS